MELLGKYIKPRYVIILSALFYIGNLVLQPIAMIDLYTRQFKNNHLNISTGRKGRIFSRLCELEKPTRKKLANEMEIRPATVSNIVFELINDGLVVEKRPDRSLQKGRPEIILRPNPNRLVAIVCHLVSYSVHCTLINLAGNILYETRHVAKVDRTDPITFFKIITTLFTKCKEHISLDSELSGLAFSLPGIVDEKKCKWIYSSHWPHLHNLDLSRLSKRFKCKITLSKNLVCELRARVFRHGCLNSKSILLLHWGLGIGAAFTSGNDMFILEKKGFGEVGHSCVDPASTALCKCGMTGCVEAEAGIWAIAKIQNDKNIPTEECKFAQYLQDNSNLNIWNRPIQLLAITIRNLCLALSPDQFIVTGPFAQNGNIFSQLTKNVNEQLPKNSLVIGDRKINLRAGRPGLQDELSGAASTVFLSSITRLCSD